MKVQSFIDHCVVEATPKPYLATMSPSWANARIGCALVQPRVGAADHLPHSYKPLGLRVGPLSHCELSFCPASRSWGQVEIFLY